jgi:hypothetical protein
MNLRLKEREPLTPSISFVFCQLSLLDLLHDEKTLNFAVSRGSRMRSRPPGSNTALPKSMPPDEAALEDQGQ